MDIIRISGIQVYVADCGIQWALEPFMGCKRHPQYIEQLNFHDNKIVVLTQTIYHTGSILHLLQELNSSDAIKYVPISKNRAERLADSAEQFEPVNDWEHYEKSN